MKALKFTSRSKITIASLLVSTSLLLFIFHTQTNRSIDINEYKAHNDAAERFVCENLLNKNRTLLEYYRNSTKTITSPLPPDYHERLATDDELCVEFKYKYPYTREFSTITESELNFPIAFAFAIYTDIDHFARLLRIMYRPHNVYIIHVDKKASNEFKRAVEGIRKCLGTGNIYILSGDYQVEVKWACFSNLQCHLNSMKYLISEGIRAVNHRGAIDWKYFINLTGQEFPLRTNYEIVQILKALNGRNHIELDKDFKDKYRYPVKENKVPHLKFYKGYVYIIVSRKYCEFTINNEKARSILKALWLHNKKKCMNGDEVYFQTLQFNPQLGTPGACRVNTSMPRQAMKGLFRRIYAVWDSKHCHSKKRIRGVCILGVDDLYYLMEDHSYMIANKFKQNFQPAAYDCMEVMLAKRAEKQQKSLISRNEDNVLVDLRLYKNTSMCL